MENAIPNIMAILILIAFLVGAYKADKRMEADEEKQREFYGNKKS